MLAAAYLCGGPAMIAFPYVGRRGVTNGNPMSEVTILVMLTHYLEHEGRAFEWLELGELALQLQNAVQRSEVAKVAEMVSRPPVHAEPLALTFFWGQGDRLARGITSHRLQERGLIECREDEELCASCDDDPETAAPESSVLGHSARITERGAPAPERNPRALSR